MARKKCYLNEKVESYTNNKQSKILLRNVRKNTSWIRTLNAKRIERVVSEIKVHGDSILSCCLSNFYGKLGLLRLTIDEENSHSNIKLPNLKTIEF